ncbi:transposase [Jiella flava]|uniref:Transposase n=1 Tax=Jiella flava TaxID=2816857 RepID=A0A939JST1_9HYPH|nr:transposase [Jiella flava]
MKAICAAVNVDFFMEFSSSRFRDHPWKIPAENASNAKRRVTAHNGAHVTGLIEAAGGERLHLPPYSPDPNAIEQAFAKLKHLLHRPKRQTVDDLWNKISILLGRVQLEECCNSIETPDPDPPDVQDALKHRPENRNRFSGRCVDSKG